MSGKIGGHSVSHLLSVAQGVVEKKTKDSVILDVNAEDKIPKFDTEELILGKVLGRGGFCVVSEVKKINLVKKDNGNTSSTKNGGGGGGGNPEDEHAIHNIVQDRAFMAEYCIRKGKDFRYAVKKVQEASRKDEHTFVNAVVDLAVEARFLSVVRHPNVIKMRAMYEGSPYKTEFFVVLDKLYDIMPDRMKKWKSRKGGVKSMFKSKKAKQAFWVERLTVAYDIACALSYLHGLNVVYRDLKPDNLGFDVRGDVKLFDFGLAKELDPKTKLEDGTYNLTADTGSLRYMAPENALGKPYNETADTFSFAILCWQICSLETPYEGYSMAMFQKNVIKAGTRPKINLEWGQTVCSVLRESFVGNPKRPSMNEVCELLRDEINKLSDDEIVDVMDASRKSYMSAHGGR